MNKATLWLRLASIVTFLFALGHTIGFSQPSGEAGEQAIRNAMQSSPFDLVGTRVNYWDLFLGFGYSIGLLFLMQAVLLWLTAGAAARNEGIARPSIIVFLLANAINMALLLKYFFIVPQVFEGVIVVLLVIALITDRRAAGTA